MTSSLGVFLSKNAHLKNYKSNRKKIKMTKTHYEVERTGQMDFFDNYGIDYQNDNSILVDDTDGIYQGNILEFKLNISNLGKVLFQAIKYLSHLRINGESIPARILLIDLNATTAYVFNSKDYLDDIEQVYVGGASKHNDKFDKPVNPIKVLDYSKMVDSDELGQYLLKTPISKWYTPVHIDENDIVGWANRYYREVPNATKGDFLGDDTGQVKITGEIRDPKHFKDLIYPYTNKTNAKFKYLMDCLNDRLSKKDLGAFYTPEAYAEKASELVMDAVGRVPKGNDYIILDRCAGSGNLEQALVGKYDDNGDELISHAVVSTYEYYEYKVLFERLGNKVRNIIPPTEANVVYANGKVANADAMSKEYIDNPILKKYVDDPKMTIILFENPPYRDDIASNGKVTKKVSLRTPFVEQELKKDLPNLPVKNISTARDLSNQFIWSAFKYYMRKETDSYILFSPVKYWKALGLANGKFIKGYVFNRKYFHATASAIACIEWQNIFDIQNKVSLSAIDIDKNTITKVVTKQVHNTFLSLFDKRSFADDKNDGIVCNFDGTECTGNKKVSGKPIYNKNIVGYLVANSFYYGAQNQHLLRTTAYNGRGFLLRNDIYLTKLPLWVSKLMPFENWYEKDVYATTADGGTKYTKDKAFLQHCLLYTCLSNQNKCLSFTGSDKRYYRNELCFDDTNGATQALKDLDQNNLSDQEQNLLDLWNNILEEAKKTANYDSKLTYGVYQITKELNTFHNEGVGTRQKKVADYPVLNGYLVSLRDNLKQYYLDVIKPDMFKYELVK